MRQEPMWLKEAVFYQIYPQSFCDSNGDGIGDLPGICSKLDYIRDTGFNAIWLNPINPSPFHDAGYDVSDFYNVAPRYGTMADFKNLLQEAHRRGIKVVLDLVAGHTSIEHPFFQESCRADKNRYSNYYIWNNDWLEDNGGLNMIGGFSERNGSFAVNFFSTQPALNYGFANPDPAKPWQLSCDHPEAQQVAEELKKVMIFWLELGVDGFRVDLAPSLIKKDPGRLANIRFWKKFRQFFDQKYPECCLIAEWSYAPQALEAGFHTDFMVFCGSSAYTSLFRNEPERDIFRHIPKTIFYEQDGFDYTLKNPHSFFDRSGLGDIGQFMNTYLRHYLETCEKGYISMVSSNHDMPRLNDNRSDLDLEVIHAFLLTMPGVPFIYYGDEIGMRNVRNLKSVEGGYTRVQARTPMQWDASDNAGFSDCVPEKLYLPLDPAPDRPNVAEMLAKSDSLLLRFRELLQLRKKLRPLWADGSFRYLPMPQDPAVLAFIREYEGEKILLVFSPAAKENSFELKLPHTSIEEVLAVNLTFASNNNKVTITTSNSAYAIFKYT